MRKTIHKESPLADFINRLDYGEFVRYQDIERIVGSPRGTQAYYQAVAKAKKILEEKGKIIKSCGKGDYRVIYPGDYVVAYTREIRLANNRVKHGDKILRVAPVNDMTVVERNAYNRVNDFHVILQARMAGNVVEVKRLAERTVRA